MSIQQPTALVTGVSSGIGLAIAKDLLRQGYQVFGSVRRLSDGDELVAFSDSFSPLVFDVTDVTAIESAVQALEVTLKRRGLDVLINNAGIGSVGPIMYQSMEEIRFVFDVNVFGLMNVTRAFSSLLGAQKNCPYEPGRIINISSVSGVTTAPFMSVYSASKHAVEAISQGFRRELSPFGIEVCTIQPGFIRTNLIETNKEKITDVDYAGTIYQDIWPKFLTRLGELDQQGKSTDLVVNKVNELLSADKPRTRNSLDFIGSIAHYIPDRIFDKMLFSMFKLKEFMSNRV